MTVFDSLNGQQRLNLFNLFTAGLLFWAGLASLLPTLPLYIQHVGGDEWVGTVMACFALGLLLSKAPLSKMIDRQGRKLVLLLGMSAIAIAPLGYFFFSNIPALMMFRAVHGISIAAFATAYSALVVDVSPRHCRGELIGYMSLVNPMGMAVGPAIGGFLQQSAGFSPAILLSAALGIIGLLFTMRIAEPDRDLPNPLRQDVPFSNDKHLSAKTHKRPEPQKFWSLLLTPRIRIPALVLFVIGIAFGTLSTFIPLYMQEQGVDLNIGLFYTVSAIMSFSARLVIGRASDRYGRGIFITLSLLLYGTAMSILWQAQSAPFFLLGAAIQGCGAGTLIPMISALMADRAQPHERGQMFGLCMVGFDLGIAIAGPVMQQLALQLGYGHLFGIVTAMIVFGLIVFLTHSSKDLMHSLKFALGKGKDVYAVD
ncbi:MAG: MFS transporter [Cyanobacteria bacterium P01_F01_bin.150]